MSLAQHSKVSNEHYTPLEYIEAARAVMGGIDLDPAATKSVNERRVKATGHFTKKDNALDKPWGGLPFFPVPSTRVWLNPPGGLVNRKSAAAVWWAKLVREWDEGRVSQAIFLGFSIEILQTSQWDSRRWLGSFPFCVPRQRIAFLQEINGEFIPGDQPSHGNIIAYLPPRLLSEAQYDGHARKFQDAFSGFGAVRL
jgi:hypothetical protein